MNDTLAAQHEQALEQAAYWFASLQGEQVSSAERKAWQQWLAKSSINREAWAKVEQIDRQFHRLPAQESYQALSRAGRSRRQFLYGLAGIGLTLPFVWSQRETLDAAWSSQNYFETAVGEQRQLALKDGSQLWLNTDTLVSVDEQPNHSQTLYLRRGELYWEAAGHAAPIVINTNFGRVQATGSAMGTRLESDSAYVAMTNGQADVMPRDSASSVRVERQQTLHFNHANAVLSEGVSANVEAWRAGFLVADNMRLDDFVRDLDRYHPRGWLKCSEAVANLRLIGHYSLTDTDRVLDALTFSLPVTVRHITPWFTLIESNKNISHS